MKSKTCFSSSYPFDQIFVRAGKASNTEEKLNTSKKRRKQKNND